MPDQTKTTENPDLENADALEQPATGDVEDQGARDAESEGDKTDWKAIALGYKSKVERVNELEARVKELEGDSPQPPVAENPEVVAKGQQIDELLARAEEFKRRGDPVAALTLETRAELLNTQRDLILQRQLDKIPEVLQDKVLKKFNSNRHRLGDINAAYNEIRNPELEKENRELRDKLALLEKGPDPEVVNAPPTHGERTARETKKKWTEDQFDQQANRIRQEKGELAYLRFLQDNASNIG